MQIDKRSAYDYVTDALLLYGIKWSDTWSGMIVMAVLLSCCDKSARTVPDYSAALEDVANNEGIAIDTIRRIVTDVMRPIIGDSPTGHRRRLGVNTKLRGVAGVLDLVMRYAAVRARAAQGQVYNCRIVAPDAQPARRAGMETPRGGVSEDYNAR